MRPLTAKDGSDPTPAALPWAATQGRAPLTGRRFIHQLYYKEGSAGWGLRPQTPIFRMNAFYMI